MAAQSATPPLVTTLSLGPLETNCYLLTDPITDSVLCIDPGAESARIMETVRSRGWHPCAIALTHGHGDHIGAVATLRHAWNVPVYVHELDAPMLPNAERNLSVLLGHHVVAPHPDHHLTDDGLIACGSLRLKVIHTPGHTPGSVCFFLPSHNEHPPLLFSGDTLFCEEVGRCDLPGGSWDALHTSIRTRLYTLPPSTIVYPGHGPSSTIAHEQRYNPYVRLIS